MLRYFTAALPRYDYMALERIQGIVIDVVRHSDRHNVVTLYTRERGRMAFLSPAGTGKAGRMRNSRLMPMAAITADIRIKGNRELQLLGAVMPLEVWHDLYFNPVKSSIVMFLSEFLNAFLRQSEPEPALWDFIFASLRDLDRSRRGVANRHLAFLVGLLPFAGIQPDISGSGYCFDMREGTLDTALPLHQDYIGPEELPALRMILRMTAANCRAFRFNATGRRRCLAQLIRYYAIHYPGLANLSSPAILAETFA